MIEIRSFLNSDVPELVNLWNRQEPVAGRLPAITATMLETHVFSKSYFDPAGLLIAAGGGSMLGAAICGFAPNAAGQQLDWRCGVLSHAWLAPDAPNLVWTKLIEAAIAYFAGQGSQVVFAGSCFPHSPYLTGFCGGTFVPGVNSSDCRLWERLNHSEFRECSAVDVLKLNVETFKPPVDRRVVMAKRSYEVRLTIDPQPETWWQFNVSTFRHQLDFRMIERKSNRVCGFVSFCNTRPQDSGWDSRYFGIAQINVSTQLQRSGLGQAMLFDAIKDLGQRGVSEIEAQVPRGNSACQSMLIKIGFRPWYSALQAKRELVA